ncbi:MAG: hypothetical protein JW994_07405, partial [Candidatus Omnitrophica bacterium]|nr:hypothetical protein [Candidatus Omnitrophota bacterium]
DDAWDKLPKEIKERMAGLMEQNRALWRGLFEIIYYEWPNVKIISGGENGRPKSMGQLISGVAEGKIIWDGDKDSFVGEGLDIEPLPATVLKEDTAKPDSMDMIPKDATENTPDEHSILLPLTDEIFRAIVTSGLYREEMFGVADVLEVCERAGVRISVLALRQHLYLVEDSLEGEGLLERVTGVRFEGRGRQPFQFTLTEAGRKKAAAIEKVATPEKTPETPMQTGAGRRFRTEGPEAEGTGDEQARAERRQRDVLEKMEERLNAAVTVVMNDKNLKEFQINAANPEVTENITDRYAYIDTIAHRKRVKIYVSKPGSEDPAGRLRIMIEANQYNNGQTTLVIRASIGEDGNNLFYRQDITDLLEKTTEKIAELTRDILSEIKTRNTYGKWLTAGKTATTIETASGESTAKNEEVETARELFALAKDIIDKKSWLADNPNPSSPEDIARKSEHEKSVTKLTEQFTTSVNAVHNRETIEYLKTFLDSIWNEEKSRKGGISDLMSLVITKITMWSVKRKPTEQPGPMQTGAGRQFRAPGPEAGEFVTKAGYKISVNTEGRLWLDDPKGLGVLKNVDASGGFWYTEHSLATRNSRKKVTLREIETGNIIVSPFDEIACKDLDGYSGFLLTKKGNIVTECAGEGVFLLRNSQGLISVRNAKTGTILIVEDDDLVFYEKMLEEIYGSRPLINVASLRFHYAPERKAVIVSLAVLPEYRQPGETECAIGHVTADNRNSVVSALNRFLGFFDCEAYVPEDDEGNICIKRGVRLTPFERIVKFNVCTEDVTVERVAKLFIDELFADRVSYNKLLRERGERTPEAQMRDDGRGTGDDRAARIKQLETQIAGLDEEIALYAEQLGRLIGIQGVNQVAISKLSDPLAELKVKKMELEAELKRLEEESQPMQTGAGRQFRAPGPEGMTDITSAVREFRQKLGELKRLQSAPVETPEETKGVLVALLSVLEKTDKDAMRGLMLIEEVRAVALAIEKNPDILNTTTKELAARLRVALEKINAPLKKSSKQPTMGKGTISTAGQDNLGRSPQSEKRQVKENPQVFVEKLRRAVSFGGATVYLIEQHTIDISSDDDVREEVWEKIHAIGGLVVDIERLLEKIESQQGNVSTGDYEEGKDYLLRMRRELFKLAEIAKAKGIELDALLEQVILGGATRPTSGSPEGTLTMAEEPSARVSHDKLADRQGPSLADIFLKPYGLEKYIRHPEDQAVAIQQLMFVCQYPADKALIRKIKAQLASLILCQSIDQRKLTRKETATIMEKVDDIIDRIIKDAKELSRTLPKSEGPAAVAYTDFVGINEPLPQKPTPMQTGPGRPSTPGKNWDDALTIIAFTPSLWKGRITAARYLDEGYIPLHAQFGFGAPAENRKSALQTARRDLVDLALLRQGRGFLRLLDERGPNGAYQFEIETRGREEIKERRHYRRPGKPKSLLEDPDFVLDTIAVLSLNINYEKFTFASLWHFYKRRCEKLGLRHVTKDTLREALYRRSNSLVNQGILEPIGENQDKWRVTKEGRRLLNLIFTIRGMLEDVKNYFTRPVVTSKDAWWKALSESLSDEIMGLLSDYGLGLISKIIKAVEDDTPVLDELIERMQTEKNYDANELLYWMRKVDYDAKKAHEIWKECIKQHATLSFLELSKTVENALKDEGVETVCQLCKKTAGELIKIRNFGEAALDEVRYKLLAHNLYLRNEKDTKAYAAFMLGRLLGLSMRAQKTLIALRIGFVEELQDTPREKLEAPRNAGSTVADEILTKLDAHLKERETPGKTGTESQAMGQARDHGRFTAEFPKSPVSTLLLLGLCKDMFFGKDGFYMNKYSQAAERCFMSISERTLRRDIATLKKWGYIRGGNGHYFLTEKGKRKALAFTRRLKKKFPDNFASDEFFTEEFIFLCIDLVTRTQDLRDEVKLLDRELAEEAAKKGTTVYRKRVRTAKMRMRDMLNRATRHLKHAGIHALISYLVSEPAIKELRPSVRISKDGKEVTLSIRNQHKNNDIAGLIIREADRYVNVTSPALSLQSVSYFLGSINLEVIFFHNGTKEELFIYPPRDLAGALMDYGRAKDILKNFTNKIDLKRWLKKRRSAQPRKKGKFANKPGRDERGVWQAIASARCTEEAIRKGYLTVDDVHAAYNEIKDKAGFANLPENAHSASRQTIRDLESLVEKGYLVKESVSGGKDRYRFTENASFMLDSARKVDELLSAPLEASYEVLYLQYLLMLNYRPYEQVDKLKTMLATLRDEDDDLSLGTEIQREAIRRVLLQYRYSLTRPLESLPQNNVVQLIREGNVPLEEFVAGDEIWKQLTDTSSQALKYWRSLEREIKKDEAKKHMTDREFKGIKNKLLRAIAHTIVKKDIFTGFNIRYMPYGGRNTAVDIFIENPLNLAGESQRIHISFDTYSNNGKYLRINVYHGKTHYVEEILRGIDKKHPSEINTFISEMLQKMANRPGWKKWVRAESAKALEDSTGNVATRDDGRGTEERSRRPDGTYGEEAGKSEVAAFIVIAFGNLNHLTARRYLWNYNRFRNLHPEFEFKEAA